MKKTSIIIIFIFCAILGFSQESAVDNFISNNALKYANVGIYIKNITTGKVLADYRSTNIISPASTQKLITTTTALELLGGDFRFTTYLETDSYIEGGVLKGNLYIYGTGDPTLGSQKVGNQMFLYQWVKALKNLGITKIDGDVIADVSFYDGDAINPQWIWEDIGNYYAPGIFALPYLDNTLNIQLRSAAIGSVAEVVKTLPQIDDLVFENHIRCTSITYDGAYVHGVPYSNIRYLTGSIPSNHGIFGVKGDIPNPPLLLAKHFVERLRESGVEVTGKADYLTEGSRQSRQILYEHKSEKLCEIVKEINQNSNNLYAEQVFRYLGHKIQVPCTIQNSVLIEQQCWRNRGVNLQNAFIMDGSGLAPQNGISALTLVQLLSAMQKSPQYDCFYQSLPMSGESGTLKGFLKETPLQGSVVAKSGTTSRIKSYAGYINMPNGDQLAFAVLVNNANCKARVVQTYIEKLLVGIFNEAQNTLSK